MIRVNFQEPQQCMDIIHNIYYANFLLCTRLEDDGFGMTAYENDKPLFGFQYANLKSIEHVKPTDL